MKKVIRLTENDLHRIVKESVKRVLKESYESDREEAWRRQWREDYDAGRTTEGFYEYLERMSPEAYKTITGERASQSSIDAYRRSGYGGTRYGYGNAQDFDALLR